VKVKAVEPESIAAELGILPGDEILEINGRKVADEIDLKFRESEARIGARVSRRGAVTLFEIEKEPEETLGIIPEESAVIRCGSDCVFCFVDQNPKGLRDVLYVRDGDYRLSFMYGNYTTLTNAGPAVLRRIAEERLSPMYVSVHSTDPAVRRRLMRLKKDDRILDKMKFLAGNGIRMHTQIVLCPGFNDGDSLERTVMDLWALRESVISLAVVPVGLTEHRDRLEGLRRPSEAEARRILQETQGWQRVFRAASGRNFVYPSDEFYLMAGERFPGVDFYDGYPQIENGVGMVRLFLDEFSRASRRFPKRILAPRSMTIATGELASGFMKNVVLNRLNGIAGLSVDLATVPNRLFGRSVTVAGLLSGESLCKALKGRGKSDLTLLPPDVVNGEGLFLDDWTLADLSLCLGGRVEVFDGGWKNVFRLLMMEGGEA